MLQHFYAEYEQATQAFNIIGEVMFLKLNSLCYDRCMMWYGMIRYDRIDHIVTVTMIKSRVSLKVTDNLHEFY